MTETNPATCAILRAHGINPHEIPINGWDRDGYQTVRHTNDGRIVINDNGVATTHHPWPDGFNYATLLEAWATDTRAAP